MRALGSLAGLPCCRHVRCCCGTKRVSHRRTNQRAGADGKLGTFAALSLVSEVDCLGAPVHWHFDLQVKTAHLDETSLQACIVADHAVPVHSYTGRALGATSLAARHGPCMARPDATHKAPGTRSTCHLPHGATARLRRKGRGRMAMCCGRKTATADRHRDRGWKKTSRMCPLAPRQPGMESWAAIRSHHDQLTVQYWQAREQPRGPGHAIERHHVFRGIDREEQALEGWRAGFSCLPAPCRSSSISNSKIPPARAPCEARLHPGP